MLHFVAIVTTSELQYHNVWKKYSLICKKIMQWMALVWICHT